MGRSLKVGPGWHEHVERLLDLAEREERFDALRTSIAATTLEDRASHPGERDEWLDADLA